MKIINKISILSVLLISSIAFSAGYIELSGNGSISNYKNGDDSYTKTYSLGGGLAYRFISASALEVAYSNTYQDMSTPLTITRGRIENVSISLLVYPFGVTRLQPFLKVGIGYMKRRYDYYFNVEGYDPVTTINESISGNFGAGLKYYLTGNFALQGAATGYITDFNEPNPYIHHVISFGITIVLK